MNLISKPAGSELIIENPRLLIMTPVSLSQNIYLFSEIITFILDVSSGTNVQVQLYIGEEQFLKTLPISQLESGLWIKPLNINRYYKYPGDYTVTAIFSNSISSVT